MTKYYNYEEAINDALEYYDLDLIDEYNRKDFERIDKELEKIDFIVIVEEF